jgi:CzcA family heavy metal efflux pump
LSFSSWTHSHTRSIIFLLLALAIGGAASSLRLPVALFPTVSFPRVQMSIDAGDRPAERMAIEVTYPVEEALRSVPGVRSVRSTTSRGSADISINFDWGDDMVAALLQAQSQINRILPTLPQGTTFTIRRMDPTVFPAMAYSLTSDTRSLVELHDAATHQLRPAVSTVSGVAKVDVQGGAVQEFQVEMDPGKLQAYKIGLNDVADALAAGNILTAVGKIEDRNKLYLIISDTSYAGLDQIRQTILRSGANGIVKLSDVAIIRDNVEPQFVRVTADGRDAVLLLVYQQPGGNTVDIAKQVTAKLNELEPHLPSGIRIANWYDQSDLIVASAIGVRNAVLIGVGLAALVLLVFLRNWKITLIATLCVPAVLSVTILLLYVLGMSFNIMTLGGMAAAVGLIIDDAIVMVEQIVRKLHGAGAAAQQRVLHAADEFRKPLFGSSFSTIIIFAPLAFLTGVTGAFFKALSLTMAASLIVSFLVAWLVIPVLAAKWLGPRDAEHKKAGAFTKRLDAFYTTAMQRLLRFPLLVFLILIPLLLAGYFAYMHVESGFIPTTDEGGFILDYNALPGTSLSETDRLLRKVETILRNTAEVQTYSRRTGLQLGGGITEANSGDFFVRLKPFPRRDIEEVMDDVRKQVEHSVPGLEIETAQLMEDLIGDLTSVPQPIEIKIFSDDENVLADLAPKVANIVGKVQGVVEVKSGIVYAGDALDIEIDRVKASLEGADPDDITKVLNDALSGNVATQIPQGPKLIGVRVWLPKRDRTTDLDLKHLQIRAPNGHFFPLDRVAQIKVITGQPEINREDLKRMVAVTGRITGRDLGSTVADVKHALDSAGVFPRDVTYELGGLYQQQQIAFRGLLIVIIAAVSLVFLLLLFLYESFIVALTMLVIPLLAMCAVLVGLWITGTELNITSIMGMTMIVGIVTEVAIFYYSEYDMLSSDLARPQRLIEAGTGRARAITMTTIAAILALLPLAIGGGSGGDLQKPLAIAIIVGLLVQVPLVLIALPMLLSLKPRAMEVKT